jgi:hypothetical protein
MGSFLFAERMGCVAVGDGSTADHQSKLFRQFQTTVKQIFVQTAKLQFVPAQLAQKWNLQVWQDFVAATSSAFSLGKCRSSFRLVLKEDL